VDQQRGKKKEKLNQSRHADEEGLKIAESWKNSESSLPKQQHLYRPVSHRECVPRTLAHFQVPADFAFFRLRFAAALG
jgi:hypothetical protein